MKRPNFVRMKKGLLVLLLMLSFGIHQGNAQCPMCRSSVESAMKDEGNTKGLGLNDGILYLLAVPYLAVAVIGGVWYVKKRRMQP